jgi:hypothetical protein
MSTNSKLKTIYKELINNVLNDGNITDTIRDNYIKSEIFNIMLVISGYRKAMIISNHNSELLLKHVKNLIKKYNINNINIKLGIKEYYDSESSYQYHCNSIRKIILIYNKKYKHLANMAMDRYRNVDDRKLGELLEFSCINDNNSKDKKIIVQSISADGIEFYTQVCTVSNYYKNKKPMYTQFNRYKRLSKILDVNLNMTFIIYRND